MPGLRLARQHGQLHRQGSAQSWVSSNSSHGRAAQQAERAPGKPLHWMGTSHARHGAPLPAPAHDTRKAQHAGAHHGGDTVVGGIQPEKAGRRRGRFGRRGAGKVFNRSVWAGGGRKGGARRRGLARLAAQRRPGESCCSCYSLGARGARAGGRCRGRCRRRGASCVQCSRRSLLPGAMCAGSPCSAPTRTPCAACRWLTRPHRLRRPRGRPRASGAGWAPRRFERVGRVLATF